MIVLDTNVVSAMMQPDRHPQISAWLDRQPAPSLRITSVTLYESWFGIRLLPEGRRKAEFREILEELLSDGLGGEILPFDEAAALRTAASAAAMQQRGVVVGLADQQIAGIVLSRSATLATGNTKHFEATGVQLVNPWGEAAGG